MPVYPQKQCFKGDFQKKHSCQGFCRFFAKVKDLVAKGLNLLKLIYSSFIGNKTDSTGILVKDCIYKMKICFTDACL